jgi:hypothetical protein
MAKPRQTKRKHPIIPMIILASIYFLLGGLVFSDVKLAKQVDVLQEVCKNGASFELDDYTYFCFPAESNIQRTQVQN